MLLLEGSVASTSSSTSADGSDDDSSGVLRRGDERKLERQRPATQVPAASIQESPPFGKRLFGFAVSALLLGLLGYLATVVAGSFRESWRSNSWPSVIGTVKSSTVQRTGVGKNARVTYRYEVSFVNHNGHRICVEGYTKKFFESAQAVSDRYVVEQPVKVFYDPKNPVSAVLLTGTTPGLWWRVIMLALLGSSIGYGTYASFRSLIGKSLPKRAQDSTGRSFAQRAMGLFVASMIMLMVGMAIFALINAASHNWHLPRDLGEWFGLAMMLFMLAILLGLASVVCIGVYFSFKPAAKESDLRVEPGVPHYSDDSLVCIIGEARYASAVIVDDKAGMIHFRRCFRPPNFGVIKALPWFSCPLKSVTSVSQMSFKGTTTLTIHTNSGKGSITSHASGFDELWRRFPKTKTEYAPGAAPLSGAQAVMVVTGVIGIPAGMVLTIFSFALGILVAVGSIVLLVSSVFIALARTLGDQHNCVSTPTQPQDS